MKDPIFLRFSKNEKKEMDYLLNFDKMNITQKDWFCYQCSLQFDGQHVYTLHSKLLHKQKTRRKTKSIIGGLIEAIN